MCWFPTLRNACKYVLYLAPDTVITEGVLHKQGGRHKSWKVRFFRLFPGLVCYYTSKKHVGAD